MSTLLLLVIVLAIGYLLYGLMNGKKPNFRKPLTVKARPRDLPIRESRFP